MKTATYPNNGLIVFRTQSAQLETELSISRWAIAVADFICWMFQSSVNKRGDEGINVSPQDLPRFLSLNSLHTGRMILRRLLYHFHRDGFFQNDAVIVGSNGEARLLADQLTQSKPGNLRIDSYIRCGNTAVEFIDGLSCLGYVEDLESIVRNHRIHMLILVTSSLTPPRVMMIYRRFGTSNEVELRISTQSTIYSRLLQQSFKLGKPGAFVVSKIRLTRLELFIKSILDYCLTIPAVIILAPVLILLAIAIKLDSPGPVFEKKEILGVNGKSFTLYSFRTRYCAVEKNQSEQTGRRGESGEIEPEITRMGHFLFATRLDFLPRLFNVLRNEMSLVGSRMVCANEFAQADPDGINLLTLQPGITGIWQLNGCPKISLAEQVNYDMCYIDHWTIWKDIQIIFQSVMVNSHAV